MAIKLLNRMKHEVAKGLVCGILKDAKYRFVCTGMESVLREITILSDTQYNKLNLPMAFRRTPDFLVSDEKMSFVQGVEVKYRKNIEKELFDKIHSQLEHFGPFTLVLFYDRKLNQPPAQDLSHHIRCCRLRPDNGGEIEDLSPSSVLPWQPLSKLPPAQLWDAMVPLHFNFKMMKSTQPVHGNIKNLVAALA